MIQNSKQILRNKKILLISPEYWGINFISKHHYAQTLSERNNVVFYLNPPSGKNNISKINPNLYIIDYKSTFKGIRIMPSIISGMIIQNEFKRIESISGTRMDIIWNFDSSRFFNLSQIKNTLRIAHIVDWSESFNRELLCKTCDITFCTSDYLVQIMTKSNPKTYNIGHGYAPSDYKLDFSEKQEISDTFKIKVGYIGNLNIRYLDWEVIYGLIIDNPSIGFYFLGPEGISNLSKKTSDNLYVNKIKRLHNVVFLGEKSAHKIPAYLNEFSILLLAYKAQRFREQLANPHKMLEYLGSGKVIVSSWTEEYKNNQDLIEMVSDNREFSRKFREVVKNLSSYNSAGKKSKRINYAMQNTYNRKIQLIEKFISESM
jgi:hypothetical protein